MRAVRVVAEGQALLAPTVTRRLIAEALFVADQTVKTHVSKVFSKLDLRDRAQAVVLAHESGPVTPG